MFFYLLSLLFISGINLHNAIEKQIAEQSEIYINNIKTNRDTDLSFWALNEIYAEHCAANTEIHKIISGAGIPFLNALFKEEDCTLLNSDDVKSRRLKAYALETGSLPVAVAYLTYDNEPHEKEIFNREFSARWGNQLTDSQKRILAGILTGESIHFYFSMSAENTAILFFLQLKQKTDRLFVLNNLDYFNTYLASAPSAATHTGLFNDIVAYNKIKINYNLNNYSFIADNYKDFVGSETFPVSAAKLLLMNGIDFSLYTTGKFDESLSVQRKHSIPLAEYFDRHSLLDDILLRQSSNLYRIGKYKEAQVILENLSEKKDYTGDKKRILVNLSLCYLNLGEYKKYVSTLLQALPDYNTTALTDNEYTITFGAYRNLFTLYTTLGDTGSAIDYLQKASFLAESRNDETGIAALHADLGTYHWYLNHDASKALDEYNQASKIYEANTSSFYLSRVLLNINYILTEQNEFDKAHALLMKVKESAVQNADTTQYITALINELDIHIRKNDIPAASGIIKQIKNQPLDNLSFETLAKFNSLVALYMVKTGRKRQAYSFLDPVLEQVIERIKATTDVQTGSWFARHDYLKAFETMITLLRDLDDDKKALEYLDRFKSINTAVLYNNPLLRAVQLSEKELIEDNILKNQILSLRDKYLSSQGEERLAVKAEIDRLSARQQQFSVKVSGLKEKEIHIPVWKIQNRLNFNELLLHFTELNNRLYISTISKTDINIEELELTPEIRNLFKDAANKLADSGTSLHELYEITELLKLNRIPSYIEIISVIPDNYLYRIPLEVLPSHKTNTDYSYGSARYLIEDYTFEYFNSLSDFTYNNRLALNRAEHAFSAFSVSDFDGAETAHLPPLPYALKETKHIIESFTSFNAEKKQIYHNQEATKREFIKEISAPGIVHLATHSEISEQDPLFSIIYLNDDHGENDKLYAYELLGTKLQSNFIMLNSCSSGSGGYMQGAGILGISRALKYAGAKSLALNLWPVNDTIASEIAADFYTNLNAGYSKSDAMRMAKIKQIQRGNANPHYWGAYTIIGNPSPVVRNPAVAFILYPVLLTALLFLGYLTRKKTTNLPISGSRIPIRKPETL